MNELHFAFRVKQHLNSSLKQIDEDKLARLKTAREAALAVQKRPSLVPILASASHYLRLNFNSLSSRLSLTALALILAGGLYLHWHAEQIISELSDLDSSLLTDDIPVEALLDKDFYEWIKKPLLE